MTLRPFAAVAALSIVPAASAQLFVETFDDGNAASRWSAPIYDTETGAIDGSVDYAFDYSTVGIAPAPGGTSTVGIRFIANPTDDTSGDEGESIGILSNYTLPTGDFSVTMDVYAYSFDPENDFTTEYITLGVHAAAPNDPTNPAATDDVPARFGISNGNGLAYQVIPDDGSGTGVVRFEDADNANTGSQTSLGATIGSAPSGGDIFLNTWTTISIASVNGLVTYTANGVVYDVFDNTAGTFTGGSIMIGLADVFNSAAGTNVFTVIDNVTVVPEPAAAVALVGLGLASLRRRRA